VSGDGRPEIVPADYNHGLVVLGNRPGDASVDGDVVDPNAANDSDSASIAVR